jgi:8-oxo-dGTP diphosphatase
MLLEDKQGNQLLELIALDEAALSTLSPFTHALVVARTESSTLLVFNRYRQHWELAGGVIDPGETPRACAARELREESGLSCAAEALRFVGAMKFLLQPSYANPTVRIEYGALYAVEISNDATFVPNEEIAAVCWWNGTDEIGEIAAIDEKLSQLC